MSSRVQDTASVCGMWCTVTSHKLYLTNPACQPRDSGGGGGVVGASVLPLLFFLSGLTCYPVTRTCQSALLQSIRQLPSKTLLHLSCRKQSASFGSIAHSLSGHLHCSPHWLQGSHAPCRWRDIKCWR